MFFFVLFWYSEKCLEYNRTYPWNVCDKFLSRNALNSNLKLKNSTSHYR